MSQDSGPSVKFVALDPAPHHTKRNASATAAAVAAASSCASSATASAIADSSTHGKPSPKKGTSASENHKRKNGITGAVAGAVSVAAAGGRSAEVAGQEKEEAASYANGASISGVAASGGSRLAAVVASGICC